MLVAAVIMVFVLIVAIAWLSQSMESTRPPEAATKQFTVKKSRESARGLASSDRKVEGASDDAPPAKPVKSLTPHAASKTTVLQVPVKIDDPNFAVAGVGETNTVIAAIIAESYTADSTPLAMEMLTRAITDAQAPDDASKLYSAIGSLQLAQEEPNSEAGLAALRNATETAATPATRTAAAVAEASALMVHAESAEGLVRIDELLADEQILANGVHHLTLLRGDLLVEQGDLRGAEAHYESVRKAASAGDVLSNAPLFRQASLRLSRLYARTGDDKKEELIMRDLKRATMPQR